MAALDEFSEFFPEPAEVSSFELDKCRNLFRVVALGDSITECQALERPKRWTGILESCLGPGSKVVNSGIGGTTSSVGLLRWHRDVLPIEPHCVVICFFLNDAGLHCYECSSSYTSLCSIDRMDSNLRLMVDLTRSAGAAPVLWTPPPVPRWQRFNSRLLKSSAHGKEIQMDMYALYLRALERVSEDTDVPVANFWRTFPETVKDYPGPYFDAHDGLHSNEKSQGILAAGIAELIRPVFEAWAGRDLGESWLRGDGVGGPAHSQESLGGPTY